MSEYTNMAAFRSAERAYLEPPDDRMPDGVEDLLDEKIRYPEGQDEDGRWEYATITEYETWEDEDEDGMHGGVTLICKNDITGEVASFDMSDIDLYTIQPGDKFV